MGLGRPLPEPNRQRLDVIIGTYNRCASLRRCLEHLRQCDIDGLDVVVQVVDDGSKDGTGVMVQEMAAQPHPLRIQYHYQKNAGVSAARNRGIAARDADLILITDDDTAPEPNWIRGFAEGPWTSTTCAMAGQVRSPKLRSLVGRYMTFIQYDEFPVAHRPRHNLENISLLNTANCAYRRAVMELVGGFNVRYAGGGEDTELAERARAPGYRIGYTPESVVIHYHRERVAHFCHGYFVRAYRLQLRRIAKGAIPPPTWAMFRKKVRRLVLKGLRFCYLPGDAALFHKQGAPVRDALPFAYFEWRRTLALAAGELSAMYRLLRGHEKMPEVRKPTGALQTPVVAERLTG